MSFSAKKYCSVREKEGDFMKIPFEETPLRFLPEAAKILTCGAQAKSRPK